MAQILSAVGGAGFYVPLLLVVYWCAGPLLGARGLVLVAFGSALNELVKLCTAEPRPYWTDPSVIPGASVESFGMPSGHAQNAVVVWGVVAWTLGRRAAWAVAVAAALGVGWSRYALDVHSVGQVLAGWALGLALLAAAMAGERPLGRWWRAQTRPVRLITALTPSLMLLLATALAARGLTDEAFPRTWAEAVRRAGGEGPRISSDEAAMSAGFLAGCLAGLVPRAGIPPSEPVRGLPGAAARVLVGMGPLVLPAAVYLAMVNSATLFAPVVFAVFAVAGLWAVLGAPEVFRRLPPPSGERPPLRGLTRPGERFDQPEP